jgi:molybdopterin-guanine dinucleotide biosynthesis protein B
MLHAGLVLAAGRSTRMGTDKTEVLLGGKTLLRHVSDRLKAQVGTVLINSNTQHDTPYVTVPDQLADFQGPLAGILAGLRFLQKHMPHASHLLTVPVDTPFFPDNLASTLAASVTSDAEIVVARSNGNLHPVFALWPVQLADDLETFLTETDDRRVKSFFARHLLTIADFNEMDCDPFFNINTPQDLALAEKRIRATHRPKIIGISGWKNSGKTGLAVRLVSELTARGYRVSTIKHAHHDFDIDKLGADSFRHREAGAHEVTIVSGTRYAIMHELRGAAEPSFEEILSRLAPCDLVLIEGYKREPIPKIEARRLDAKNTTPLAPTDPWIRAIAADHAVQDTDLPLFDLNDTETIANFVEKITGLKKR